MLRLSKLCVLTVVMVSLMSIRTYSELILLPTFEERFEYLKLDGYVGEETFGSRRYLNQILYKTREWLSIRDKVILRDDGCDLGIPGREIFGRILVHHIEPITIEDILNRHPKVFDLNNLICVAHMTHEAIHYGSADLLMKDPVIRTQNDTCPWRRV